METFSVNWNDYRIERKRGWVVIDEGIDKYIPIFTQDRDYINRYVNIEED